MKKDVVTGLILGLLIIISLSGCGGGNGGGGSPVNTPGLAKAYTVGGVSFSVNYVPAASSFPTGTDDSGTGSVSHPFWIGETEVKYELWKLTYDWAIDAARTNRYYFQDAGFMGDGTGDTNQHPVTVVSWRDCMVWCNALTEYYNAQNGTSMQCVYYYGGAIIRDSRNANATACNNAVADPAAKGFRLPTTMEWELAARYQNGTSWTPGDHVSGDTSSYCFPSDAGVSTAFGNFGWYDVNSGSSTHPVAEKSHNALNIHDMSGNVLEWCFDLAGVGTNRVLRGGSWQTAPDSLRIGTYSHADTNQAFNTLGVRLAKNE